MTSRRLSHLLVISAVILLIPVLLAGSSFAQGLVAEARLPDAPSAAAGPMSAAPIIVVQSPRTEIRHNFFDKQNTLLFAAVAGLNAADFAVTRANLRSGGQEMNPIVRLFGRSTAGLAMNFVGETAGTVGVSYLFHKTGHHRLERIVSFVNIGGSAGAVTYGLTHR